MRLKYIEKERQQRQQVPGQVGNIKRHTREQNDATISGRNTAETCAMGRKGSRNIEIKATEPEEWANRWIATFEDETVGDMIVVWDIKVLLSKVLTRQEMEDILEDAGMKDAVGCEDYNGQSLNTYHAELWGTL